MLRLNQLSAVLAGIFLLLALSSCGEEGPANWDNLKRKLGFIPEYETAAFQDSLTQRAVYDTSLINNLVAHVELHDSLLNALQKSYANNNFKPLWLSFGAEEASGKSQQIIRQLQDAIIHGFDPLDFGIVELKGLLAQLYQKEPKVFEKEVRVEKTIEADLALSKSLLALADRLYNGKIPHKWEVEKQNKDWSAWLSSASEGGITSAVKQLVTKHPGYYELSTAYLNHLQIKENGGWPKVKGARDWKGISQRLKTSGDYDGKVLDKRSDELTDALKSFQKSRGLIQDGSVNKKTLQALRLTIDEVLEIIELNLERYRWLPAELGKEYVFVNVPGYYLDYFENGSSSLHMDVVVGEPVSPTKVFTKPMTHLVFSPLWNIPQSIAREEIWKWIQINPAVLLAGDTDCFYKGKKVNPFEVDWKTAKKDWRNYSFRQKPTYQNSLGDVKFMFPNKHAIYLHDTPAKKYFKQNYRALSAGCVRVSQPVELAEILLKGKDGWNKDRIVQAMRRSGERRVNLPEKVPVYLYYLTAWVDDSGTLQLRRDIYKHDRRQLKKMRALKKADRQS